MHTYIQKQVEKLSKKSLLPVFVCMYAYTVYVCSEYLLLIPRTGHVLTQYLYYKFKTFEIGPVNREKLCESLDNWPMPPKPPI